MFASFFTKPQPTSPQGDTTAVVSGDQAKKLFSSIIQTSFQTTEGLADDISKLFPIHKITECSIEELTFTVTFSEPTTVPLSILGGGTTCNIPMTVKGTVDLLKEKITFRDAQQALWLRAYIPYTPLPISSSLTSVEYDPGSNTFTLIGTVKTITVSRAQFQEIFKDYKLV